MKYKQKIRIGKHVQDLFRIEEVKGIGKEIGGRVKIEIIADGKLQWAYEGDWICQKEDGSWTIEKGGQHE